MARPRRREVLRQPGQTSKLPGHENTSTPLVPQSLASGSATLLYSLKSVGVSGGWTWAYMVPNRVTLLGLALGHRWSPYATATALRQFYVGTLTLCRACPSLRRRAASSRPRSAQPRPRIVPLDGVLAGRSATTESAAPLQRGSCCQARPRQVERLEAMIAPQAGTHRTNLAMAFCSWASRS